MKNAILLIIISLFSSHFIFAQAPDIEWQNRIGGDGDSELFSIQQTTDGGYILGGSSKARTAGAGDKSEGGDGSFDYWAIKINSAGTIQWENTIKAFGSGIWNDYLYSIQQTSDGGYILGGHSNSKKSFDKSENSCGSSNNFDFWVVKLNAGGTIVWENTIGGSRDEKLYSIQQTTDGGYILGGSSPSNISCDKTIDSRGTSNSGSTQSDYWLVKLNASGNITWQRVIGGSGRDELYSVQQTTDGGYILGGSSTSGISYDKSEESYGREDYWVVKVNSTGNIEWQNTIGGDSYDILQSIQQTKDGGYILGGHSQSSNSGDKSEPCYGSNCGPWNGNPDYWVIKVDSYGIIEWENTIGGTDKDYLYSVEQTTDGGYILGGYSESGISGDKISDSKGRFDFWVIRLDAFGNIYWQKVIGGDSNDMLRSIQQTTDGGYILGGDTGGFPSGDVLESGLWSPDYWVVKLYPDTPLEVEQSKHTEGFELGQSFPNPFNPTTTISYSLGQDSDVSISIFNLSGTLITALQNEYQTQGEHSTTWNGTDDFGNKVVAGAYFYQLKVGEFVETKKMILLK